VQLYVLLLQAIAALSTACVRRCDSVVL
jgi:hypothetical protein